MHRVMKMRGNSVRAFLEQTYKRGQGVHVLLDEFPESSMCKRLAGNGKMRCTREGRACDDTLPARIMNAGQREPLKELR